MKCSSYPVKFQTPGQHFTALIVSKSPIKANKMKVSMYTKVFHKLPAGLLEVPVYFAVQELPCRFIRSAGLIEVPVK